MYQISHSGMPSPGCLVVNLSPFLQKAMLPSINFYLVVPHLNCRSTETRTLLTLYLIIAFRFL